MAMSPESQVNHKSVPRHVYVLKKSRESGNTRDTSRSPEIPVRCEEVIEESLDSGKMQAYGYES